MTRAAAEGRPRAGGCGRRVPRGSSARAASESPLRRSSRTRSDLFDEGVELGAHGVAVREQDVAPQRRVRAGDARRVAEAGPGRRQARSIVAERPRRLVGEHVREHVRHVADRRHHAIVRSAAIASGRAPRAGARGRGARRAGRSCARSGSGTSARPRRARRARARRPPPRRPRAGGRRRTARVLSGSPDEARPSSTARFVEPTSVTTRRRPRPSRLERRPDERGQRPHGPAQRKRPRRPRAPRRSSRATGRSRHAPAPPRARPGRGRTR